MSQPGSHDDLSPADWEAVQTLFADALERVPGERGDFLEVGCSARPELREEIESLLRAYDRAEAFLAEPGVAAVLPSLLRPSLLGRRVGAWRAVALLGRGGMGTVYLAERADGEFEQRAALKVVKRGMDTNAIMNRFLRERQILARLDHTNIARLLDGGVTDDGRPYFVMAHVEGAPITRYCDERGLEPTARIRLFLEVCRAVQYAHRNLVVHRDLKPSNILVTRRGQVKLLDFGIAKLIEGDGMAGATTLTARGIRPVTPEYAAPEHMRGDPVTTTADVYSLGAVLHELLTGERVSGVGGRRLKGDLDTIVSAALHPEPDRRYPSVEALFEDLRRYLNGLPIQARPDSAAYRASKFVRRHLAGVAAFAVVALVLAASTVTVVVENTETARERDRARLEATKARRVSEFLTGIFEVSDPNVSRGEEITARQLLEAGAARLRAELQDQPEVEAELSGVVAGVYEKLGDYDRATPLAVRSLELRRARGEPEGRDVVIALADLGRLRRLNGDYVLADSLLGEALALARRRPEAGPEPMAAVLDEIALLHWREGELDLADSLHREALALRRAEDETDPLAIAASLARLGVVARARGDIEAAEAYHREALALRREALGDQDRLVAESRKYLALVLHTAGRLEEAEVLYRQVLEFEERLYSGRHPELATTLNSLGSLLRQRGQFGEAEAMLRRSLTLRRELVGPEHQQVATALTNLAVLLASTGRPEAAVTAYEEALAINRRVFEPDHPAVATTLNNLGLTLRDQGRYGPAAARLREAIRIYESRLGPRHYFRAYPMNNLAGLHLWRGELAAADSVYREAHALMRETLPADHPDVAMVVLGLGEVAALSGRAEDAEPLLREALAIGEKSFGAHWKVAEARSVLGDCLSRLGRVEEAERLLVSGHRGLVETLGEASIRTRRARRRLGDHEHRGLPSSPVPLGSP